MLFHGDHDEAIDYSATLRLKALVKPTDMLIVLPGARHNGMTDNPDYLRVLAHLLQ